MNTMSCMNVFKINYEQKDTRDVNYCLINSIVNKSNLSIVFNKAPRRYVDLLNNLNIDFDYFIIFDDMYRDSSEEVFELPIYDDKINEHFQYFDEIIQVIFDSHVCSIDIYISNEHVSNEDDFELCIYHNTSLTTILKELILKNVKRENTFYINDVHIRIYKD